MNDRSPRSRDRAARGGALGVLAVSLKLGVTSFGGPVAHLGYFHHEYVVRRKWIGEEAFGDLVALCQFLPGPASSQVNMSIGMSRAGLGGALAAWVGFTLPSAAAMTAFAFLTGAGGVMGSGWLHGLLLAAVAIVAQAVWAMARRLAPDAKRAAMAAVAAIVSLLVPSALTQIALIAAGAFAGRLLLSSAAEAPREKLPLDVPRPLAVAFLVVFVVLLAGLPLARMLFPAQALAVAESFYRVGSLVFGGGHVVLPLLHREVVPPGWISDSVFMAGYALAQAVPGPLFTFSAYLGSAMSTGAARICLAAISLGAIFLPSFLLLVGILPFWNELRARPSFQSALAGINAAVVGLLAAALYTPVWTSAVFTAPDFCIVLGAFALLTRMNAPPWLVVALGAAAGQLVRLVG
jgi:chromate transporter